MKQLSLIPRWFALAAIGALIAIGAPLRGAAQDTTTTSIQPGTPAIETSVRNAQVVYVGGNDLVLKLEDGRIEHLVVPDSDVFTIDGKDVGVRGLKPGTRLTQTITTTTTPHYVNSVRTIRGKVWHVGGQNSVIITLPDGANQIFRIPGDAKFYIDGQPRYASELRKGMKIEATVVTDDTHTVISTNKTVVGQAPLPRLVGVLLFPTVRALSPAPTPVASVTAEHTLAQAVLPQTASPLPLVGLLGALAIALFLGLRLAGKASGR